MVKRDSRCQLCVVSLAEAWERSAYCYKELFCPKCLHCLRHIACVNSLVQGYPSELRFLEASGPHDPMAWFIRLTMAGGAVSHPRMHRWIMNEMKRIAEIPWAVKQMKRIYEQGGMP